MSEEAIYKLHRYPSGELEEFEYVQDLVRCKECRWAEPNREGDYDCRCHIPIFRVIADDYCSYGERKE